MTNKLESYLDHEELAFTQIFNIVAQARIHDGALALYLSLMSRPKNWRICYKQLANQFFINERTVQKRIKYLIDIGLINNFVIRESGRFICFKKVILRNPNEKFKNLEEVNKSYFGKKYNKKHSQNDVQITVNMDVQNIPETPEIFVQKESETQAVTDNSPYVEKLHVEKLHVEKVPTYKEITTTNNICLKNIYKCKSDLHKSEINKKFEEFWNLYPLKKNKKRSKGIWVREKIYEKWDEVKEKLVNQLNNCTSFKEHPTDGLKYFKHPSTYLNGENWNDEITPKQNKAVTTGNAETIQPVFVHDEETARKKHDEKFGIGKFNTNSFPIAEQIQNITKKLRLNASKGVVKKRSE